MTKIIKEWANAEQEWIYSRGAAPSLLVGGVDSGKTVGCVLKLITLLHRYPGSRAIVVRRSYTQLLKTTMETFYQWCTPQMYSRGNRTEGQLDLNNGSRVYFIHLDQPNSLDLLAGLEINFAYVSQVEEITEKAWDLMDVRVGRWTGAVIPAEEFEAFGGPENWPWRSPAGVCVPPRYIFAEGYVTDESHWLYLRFAEESPEREKWKDLGYESQIVYSENNIYAVKATIDTALSKDEDYIRRYVRPVWGNPEGKIFKVDKLSVLKPDQWLVAKIQQAMKLYRALDHGEFVPACCLWFATDYDRNIFVYREYYKPDALVSEHRSNIFELSKLDCFNSSDVPKYYSNLADPSIFNVSRGRTVDERPSWSVADEYTDTKIMDKETVIRWRPAENGEEVTRSRMKEYLRIDPNHRHPVTGKMGAPHLYFLKKTPDYPHGCNMVLKEIGAQVRVRVKVGDRDVWTDERNDKVSDHAYDACKYFVVDRPPLGPPEPPKPDVPGEMKLSYYEEAQKAVRNRRRLEQRMLGVGSHGYGR